MGRLFDGTCRLCEEEWKGQGMTSHVKRCLTEHANLAAVHHGLLVGIRADGIAGRYWMYVLVRPEAPLEALDAHLREAWFDADEARPSVFEIEGTRYLSTVDEVVEAGDDPDEEPVEPMSVEMGAVIRPRMEFQYLYDPVQPTELEFTVYDPYPIPERLVGEDDEAQVVTVGRNDLGDVECDTCGGTATQICLACADADEPEHGPLVCEECRETHEGALQPIENTPRAGREDREGE